MKSVCESLIKMQKLFFSLFFIKLICPIFPTRNFGESRKFLHVYSDIRELNNPLIIKNDNHDLVEALHTRYRRDLTTSDRNDGLKNITVKVNKYFVQNFTSLLFILSINESFCFFCLSY